MTTETQDTRQPKVLTYDHEWYAAILTELRAIRELLQANKANGSHIELREEKRRHE